MENNDWEERGKNFYLYKGEYFYTITPIPNYYRRRSLCIEIIKPYIMTPNTNAICDFGCGDGYYIKELKKYNSSAIWYGIDISSTMLQRAQKNAPDALFLQSEMIGNVDIKFDLIYSIAVFAHILSDEEVSRIFKSAFSNLKDDALFIIFEQIAPKPYIGSTFIKRSVAQYKELAKKVGLEAIDSKVISFPAHQFFERRIAKLWYKYLTKNENDQARRIEANKSTLFRLLSSIFTAFTLSPVKRDNGKQWGYAMIVFKKLH
jgi:SAM-dependent methyltransferase